MFPLLTTNHSGGAIGAGLFIGSGNAFQSGGPASVFLGFTIVGSLSHSSTWHSRHVKLMHPQVFKCMF